MKDVKTKSKKMVYSMDVSDNGSGKVSPCIVIEGEAGFYQTDIIWPVSERFTWDMAKERCKQMNIKMGHTKEDCQNVIDESIRLQILNENKRSGGV